MYLHHLRRKLLVSLVHSLPFLLCILSADSTLDGKKCDLCFGRYPLLLLLVLAVGDRDPAVVTTVVDD